MTMKVLTMKEKQDNIHLCVELDYKKEKTPFFKGATSVLEWG